MSYHLLQSILGATFVGIWAFIAVTTLRDKLTEARKKRTSSSAPAAPKFSRRRRRQRERDRAVAGV